MNIPIMSRVAKLALAWTLVCGLASAAHAQGDAAKNYPNKPIRIVVGLAAGGGTDIITRLVGQKLSDSLGQPVLVENKPGVSGIVGADFVAKAHPDGYTLLIAPIGAFVFNSVMYKKLPYSPLKDFVPVSMVATFPLVLAVSATQPASQPIHSVKDLVAHIKANPRSANYSGASSAFQLAMEMFKSRTGTQMEFIPYKGSNDAINAVLSGDVLTTLVDAGPASGPLKGGKLRGLAVTSPERLPFLPDIPTMAEAGFAGMEIQFWMGLFAPAGTPAAIVAKLQGEINRIVKLTDIRERMNALSVSPASNTSEEFSRNIAAEIASWSALAKASNIKPAD